MSSYYRNCSIREQVKAVHNGNVSGTELATAVRTDITRYETALSAWVAFADVGAKPTGTASRGSEEAPLPLAGVSIGVKDIIDVAGLPTRCGSPVTADQPADFDAACVSRLRELGAVVQGKTVTTEFGYFSPGPTANPWNHECTPGGSSSGSAAAVGANTISAALGTQTAGSLTRPASYCGTAGMVLSPGSTLMNGISGLSESLDSLGILTRSVSDLEYLYSAFTSHESESTARPDIEDTVLHKWDGSGLLQLAPEMLCLLSEVPSLGEKLEVGVETLNWSDHVHTLTQDHKTVMSYEAARTMDQVMDRHSSQLSPQLQQLLNEGISIREPEYSEALIRRDASYRVLERLLSPSGVILGPAASGPAPEASAGTGSPDLSRPWQLMGMSVVVVPGALTGSGMPLGLQLIGLPGTERRLLEVGRRLEPLLRQLPAQSRNTSAPTLKDSTW